MDTVQLLDLHIDRSTQQVRRDDVLLPVSGLSWRLFDCLLAHGTAVVSFDTLARDVWAPAVVGEDAISQRVKLLRQALGDDGRRPRYVRSVRGRGYQLCALPQPVVPDEEADTAVVHRPRRWGWAVAGVGVLVAATLAVVMWPASVTPSPASPLLQRADHYAGIGQASNNQRAIVLYRQALQVDPESIAARRGLARALAAEGCLFNGPRQSAEEALALANDVLRRAPDDAAAFAARGYAHDCLGAMAQAVADYRQALQRDPGDDATRASLAYLYQEQGHLAQALQDNLAVRTPERVRFLDVQIARELELLGFTDAAARRHQRNFQLYPDNVFANIAWPRSLLVSGDQARAESALAQALTRGTPHPGLLRLQGELELMQGNRAAAAETFERSRQLRPQQSLGQTLAGLHGSAPASPEWVAARLQTLSAQPDDGWADAALERALLHQAQGDVDAALADLQHAVTAGFRDARWLRATPLFSRLRAAPGYARLLATIDADVAAQRARVLAAPWRPDDLKGLSATPATGSR
ncbi:winged helix-turn-helix domain-containing protein [Stenotrophomonas sp.]|uniref:winged helix-turn-helix domain-containing protein n=1 Tax=Stenotrophomonas sp. TaxID=69392 RepID=UPI00289B91DC|nr:winged helix-turn-helix domain-containing protein [Stenotrophomonas sp.]